MIRIAKVVVSNGNKKGVDLALPICILAPFRQIIGVLFSRNSFLYYTSKQVAIFEKYFPTNILATNNPLDDDSVVVIVQL